ncbi:hypothetical protein VFPPC_14094 [Pochonia chlamydosporia 170]|uniref:Uncharacterized protein n=1 Tax=Pochonia chlamydosporia 170 TaxID=1380566 RepID=A0A179F654_METCM|nr:hypothetical protein VFPPC_14094 [Pochonia chlamydosporia 170]OAQ60589.1 hypothetical protein VFPPC_14094 [Pochonia chlamydosporia 170]
MNNTASLPTDIGPPAGYHVNFDDPQRLAVREAYWLGGTGLLVSFLFMAQRMYTQVIILKCFQLEDALFLIAWITSLVVEIMSLRTEIRFNEL